MKKKIRRKSLKSKSNSKSSQKDLLQVSLGDSREIKTSTKNCVII